MAENTNQAQKEALMKGSPWLKDLMLNPHLNKFMKDAYRNSNASTSQTTFIEAKKFKIAFITRMEGPIMIKVILEGANLDSALLLADDSKVNVYDLILRYGCLHQGKIIHQQAPETSEAIQFTSNKDIPGKNSKEITFFDLFYLCKHRTKVEDKKHHEFTKYHDNSK